MCLIVWCLVDSADCPIYRVFGWIWWWHQDNCMCCVSCLQWPFFYLELPLCYYYTGVLIPWRMNFCAWTLFTPLWLTPPPLWSYPCSDRLWWFNLVMKWFKSIHLSCEMVSNPLVNYSQLGSLRRELSLHLTWSYQAPADYCYVLWLWTVWHPSVALGLI